MSQKRMAFALRGEETDALELDIYDVIGDSWWGGISAKSVLSRLGGQGKKPLRSRINSGGGDVTEGMAIYTLVKEHEGRTVATIDGLAASMASVIALAFDEVQMSENAMFMIHNPWGFSLGEADDHRKTAELLDKMRGQIADIYVARTGLDRDRVLAMMSDETWLTANEAKELGFVDVVKPAKKSSTKATAQAFARVDLSGFSQVPPHVQALVAASQMQLALHEPPTTPSGRDENQSPAGEENHMSEELKKLYAALGSSNTEEALAKITAMGSVAAMLGKLEALAGAKGEEAFGVLKAAVADSKELAGTKAELAAIRASTEKAELDAAFASAHSEKKITPVEETELRAQIEAKEMTAKGVIAYLAKRSPNPVLANQDGKVPQNKGSGAKGQGYEHLTTPERLKLQREDEETFNALRADWEKRGCPVVQS